MKKILLFTLILALTLPLRAIEPEKVKPVKNVIVLITDGTSLATISTARWLQVYRNPEQTKLNIDPWLCGTIRTNNSDAPIGDSAPTTSCYMTGQPSRAGYVATFPPDRGEANLCDIDPKRAYAPAATILEAGKQLKGKSAGIVITCHFPHATPADCSAHYYNRGAYGILADQMVHNNIDVLIGGGNNHLNAEGEAYLKSQGYNVYRNNIKGMRSDKGTKMWSLFGPEDMDYDIDRNPEEQPSLAEMTKTAISKLSKNKNGFFLMVEGSKVDWAAHANDPAAVANELLAFDKACGEAFEFAKKDGNTVVIVAADHGTGGITLGRAGMGDYSHMPLKDLMGPIANFKASADGLENMMNAQPLDSLKSIFKNYANIELSKEEIQLLLNSKGYKNSPIPVDLREPDKNSPLYSSYLSGVITNILNRHSYLGWTTGGHTGEDVFLACYNPDPMQRIMGMNTNVEVAHYIQALFGMYGKMTDFNDRIFARHADVFKNYNVEIQKSEDKKIQPTLVVKNTTNGKVLTIRPFTNIIELTEGSKTRNIQLASVITYVDRNDMFYLPSDLDKYLK